MPGKNVRRRGALRLRRKDSAYVARGASPQPVQIVRGQGSYLFDASGRRYLDFVMGWWVGNLGWGHEEISKAIREYDGPDYVAPSYLYRPWATLAELLAELAPGDLTKCYRATGGTEAVDIALQIAFAYTGRKGIVAIEDSYHGNSVGTVSIAATSGRGALANRLSRCHAISPPLDDARLSQVERLLKTREIAAFVMEPVITALGVIVPSPGFMGGLSRLCRRYGTLLVFDEVACGMGRTGRLFAAEHFEDAQPDIICLAKALTGGYAAMGATLTSEKIASAIEEEISFYSTFGWHPRSVAASLAVLRHFQRHRGPLMRNVEERGAQIAARLAGMALPEGTQVRAKGLAIGIEFEDPVEDLAERCRENGLLIGAEDNRVMLSPALNVDAATVDEGMDRFGQSLRRA